jgi:mono/diheme cytochrome c family protein
MIRALFRWLWSAPRPWRWLIALAGVLVVVIAIWLVDTLQSNRTAVYADITEHFKYGSIGSEPGGSFFQPVGGVLPPYAIFKALPSICPDRLPGGYASLGLIFEPGHDLPIGVSRRLRFGIEQVGLNCGVCHTSTVRDSPDAQPRIILGMPAQQLDLQGLVRFVLECSLDNRMTSDAVKGRIDQLGIRPTLFERLLIRSGLLMDRLKLQTLDLSNRIHPVLSDRVTAWGNGRVDTFNPYKAVQFNWRLDQLPDDELIAPSDYPSLWNQAPREGLHLHWDGNNTSVDERNLSAALGAGVTPVTVDHASIKRIRDWTWTLKPPAYPYQVDRSLASDGSGLYQRYCQNCHAGAGFRDGVVEGARVGQVEAIADINTDRHRFDSYTPDFASNQYALYPDSEYRFKQFRKTIGYANHPLDGIWLRGPYLHNGSVPTLRALLDAPERRPARFYRGYDVFDQKNVGFVSDVPAANGRSFSVYDTSLPGNSNRGHLYGTGLSDDQKAAIVEYMKTF